MSEHNSLFLKAYNTRWAGVSFIGAYVARRAFCKYECSKLPVTTNPRYVDVTNDEGSVTLKFILTTSNIKGCRKHRVFTMCAKCGKAVPVGRIHQHKCQT